MNDRNNERKTIEEYFRLLSYFNLLESKILEIEKFILENNFEGLSQIEEFDERYQKSIYLEQEKAKHSKNEINREFEEGRFRIEKHFDDITDLIRQEAESNLSTTIQMSTWFSPKSLEAAVIALKNELYDKCWNLLPNHLKSSKFATLGFALILFLLFAYNPGLLISLIIFLIAYLVVKAASIESHASREAMQIRQQYSHQISVVDAEKEKQILAFAEARDRKLQDLENRLSHASFNMQQTILDEIEQERKSLIDRLNLLDTEVSEILEKDKKYLINRGLKGLSLVDPDNEDYEYRFGSGDSDRLITKEIPLLVGKASDKPSDKLIAEYFSNAINFTDDTKSNLLINEEDFYNLIGLDKRRKYGVYEFLVVFFCSNFFSYYRCYWNFIKRSSVDEEFFECPYDTIVSIKIQERSSLRQQDPNQKRVYKEFLYIELANSKIIRLQIPNNRKEKINSQKHSSENASELSEAARELRDFLRQRRIDFQYMRSVE